MTRWNVTRLTSGLGEHAAAWDALNQRLFAGHPMLDSRFVNGLLQHFGDGSEYLCILETDGTTEAMCVLSKASFGNWRTFTPSQAQISPLLIEKITVLNDLIRNLPGSATRLELLCIDSNFVDVADIMNAAKRMDHALTMSITLKGDFNNYWATRSKKLIQNIGRYERRLNNDNISQRLVCITSPNDINDAVMRYAKLESAGWKANAGTALDTNNSQGIFYANLMQSLASSGRAMVYELWLNNTLAASRLVIASDSMIVMLKTTYDQTLKQYAPGRLLLRIAIQDLFLSHPKKTLEFYTDADSDQLTWATEKRWISHWSLFKSENWGNVYEAASAIRHALTAQVPSTYGLGSTDTVEVFQHPNQLPDDVRWLFKDAEIDSFQFGFSWYKNLVDTVYQQSDQLQFFILKRNGRPVAALPLRAINGRLGWRIESLGNYYTSLYSPILAPDLKYQDFAQLLAFALKTFAPVTELRLFPMNAESVPYRRLRNAIRSNGLVGFDFFCFGNWYLPAPDSWHCYLHARSGQLKSNISRASKKFSAAGGVLELILGGAELERGIIAFESVYSNSWKRPEPYPTFVPGLIRAGAERGWLRLGIAWLDGTPVAAQFWIVANGKANIYKLAYDENFKKYGTGTLLTSMLMEYVIDTDHVVEVDFLAGDDPYKNIWMTHRRERLGIVAYNPKSIVGFFNLCWEIVIRGIKPWFAQSKSYCRKPAKRNAGGAKTKHNAKGNI